MSNALGPKKKPLTWRDIDTVSFDVYMGLLMEPPQNKPEEEPEESEEESNPYHNCGDGQCSI